MDRLKRNAVKLYLAEWIADINKHIRELENLIDDEFAKGSIYDAAIVHADGLRVTLRAALNLLDGLEEKSDDDNSTTESGSECDC